MNILVELKEPTFDHYMDLKFYLDDILEAIAKIRDYTAGLDYAPFFCMALTYNCMI